MELNCGGQLSPEMVNQNVDLKYFPLAPVERDLLNRVRHGTILLIESFLYEWETYGTELLLRYGITDILFNQSQHVKSLINQSEFSDTARSRHGTITARHDCTITT